ncbi:peptide deformylase [Companilactobacillus baiquanensis]|uniref:Peptide deformylase n=1 Tax=Companilactobacillus baiquanensis TaxID=2486005 RepID=A0ABW1USG5_9LACO|nr:peptide deformylase [Companilactobacillus baiquanensis]
MIKQINKDTTLLSQKSTPATPKDSQVITDLLDTLKSHQADCVGMAANMIGINKRIIAFQLGNMAIPLINPTIIKKSEPYDTEEGCLSLSGQRKTKRYKNITVTYLDASFKPQKQEFSDFVAEIIQHEMDHLEGILI